MQVACIDNYFWRFIDLRNLPRLGRFLERWEAVLTDLLPSTWREIGHRIEPHQEGLSIFSWSAKKLSKQINLQTSNEKGTCLF